MTTEQYINRLCRNIKAERFAWDKYLTPQHYCNLNSLNA